MSERSALTTDLAVNRAHAAARAGDLDQAARFLASLDEPDDVEALDLRARVHAQRGELTEADACWARLQAVEPEHAGAADGRRTIAKITSRNLRVRPLVPPIWTAGAAALLVVAGGITGIALSRAPAPAPAPAPVGAAVVSPDAQRADDLQRRLVSLEGEQTAAADRRSREVAALADRLAGPGVRVERRAADVRVVFDNGLFVGDAQISRAGTALLTDVGRRLAGSPTHTTVVGHVVAVPGGRTSGGSTVALDRAEVAMTYLAAGSGLPLTAFSLVSADQADGPFPDAVRNRTVTLLVAPA